MKKIVFTLLSFLGLTEAFATDQDEVLKQYYLVSNALVIGDFSAAHSGGNALSAAIGTAQYPTEIKTQLLTVIKLFNSAANIQEQRKHFAEISDLLIKSAKQSHAKGVNVFFCPMKKAYWLGNTNSVRNPYYGSAMLTCGKLTETIQ